MLTVALNQIGTINRENFIGAFMQLFQDFKTVKLVPRDDLPEGRLQMCQPEKDEDLLKDMEIYLDSSESFLELRGPKAKLQKAVRSMFFLGKENKRVLLAGDQGIVDFPWAIQIGLIKLPAPGGDPDMTWVRKADVLIVDYGAGKEKGNFTATVKKINPEVPMFTENIQAGLSKDLKDCLEHLFAVYGQKRGKIQETLAQQYPDRHLTCPEAHRIAGKLGVGIALVGNVCDQYGYRITHCSLGCF